jgi:integrase
MRCKQRLHALANEFMREEGQTGRIDPAILSGIACRTYRVPRSGLVQWRLFRGRNSRHTFRSWLDAVGTAVGVQQKMMRHADVATTMNIYGKGMMDSKLEAHTKLLEYARVGFSGVTSDLASKSTS